MTREERLREDLVRFGKLVYDRRLTFGSGGNISARLDDGSVLVTPSGTCKGLLRQEEMIVVRIEDGKWYGERKPSMETPFHTAIYRARKDVGAVIHCHPPSCTVLAIAGIQVRPTVTPEGAMVLGREVPTAPYATPGSEELAQVVVGALSASNACLLQKHGAVAVGRDLMEAFNRLETLEYIATLQLDSADIGRFDTLPEQEIDLLLKEKDKS